MGEQFNPDTKIPRAVSRHAQLEGLLEGKTSNEMNCTCLNAATVPIFVNVQNTGFSQLDTFLDNFFNPAC